MFCESPEALSRRGPPQKYFIGKTCADKGFTAIQKEGTFFGSL